MKPMLFIVNPCSGKVQIKSKLLQILDIFAKNGYDIRIVVTQHRGHASEAVMRWGADCDLIVCSGGDGTLNEVICGMVTLDQIPPLGYIPSGSTNDFASSLSISKNMIQAARDIVSGVSYPIDIGKFAENQNFAYIAAFGAFTEVSYLTPQDKKNTLGHQAYMLESVKSLASIKAYQMKVSSEEGVINGRFIFGMVTNTMSVAGFKGLVTQDVELNDGKFEVLLIRAPKTPLDLSNIINYMFLREETNPYVHKFRTNSLNIVSSEPVDWVLDGEFGGSKTKVEIINMKKKINIMRNHKKIN